MRLALIQTAYLLATALFVFALHWMNDPRTARRGVISGVVAMFMAVVGTMIEPGIIHWGWIALALVLGFAAGVPLSQVPLTAVPQRTALSHAFGGLGAGLVGTAEYYLWLQQSVEKLTAFRTAAIIAEIILGYLTFTGSLMAAGKLQEIRWIPQRPVTYPLQNASNLSLLGIAIVCGIALIFHPVALAFLFPVIIALALAFGILFVIPIGGADMPTVISLLNSYAGLSAVAMGFVLDNKLLVTAGALDGSSGLILSIIMCRAINRSFSNVLFGPCGTVHNTGRIGEQQAWQQETDEAAAKHL